MSTKSTSTDTICSVSGLSTTPRNVGHTVPLWPPGATWAAHRLATCGLRSPKPLWSLIQFSVLSPQHSRHALWFPSTLEVALECSYGMLPWLAVSFLLASPNQLMKARTASRAGDSHRALGLDSGTHRRASAPGPPDHLGFVFFPGTARQRLFPGAVSLAFHRAPGVTLTAAKKKLTARSEPNAAIRSQLR